MLSINILTPEIKHNYNNSIMPVIKVDYKGKILYANNSSFDLLTTWNCLASSAIPKHIYENLIKGSATFVTHYNNKKINFIIVPFPEAGYIGVYAYEIISEHLHN